MTRQLKNQRCLIVGGTSGLGLAAARRFVDEGATLAVAGLHAPEEASGLAGVPVLLHDASDTSAVRQLFQEAISVLGGLDVLYHVAGMSGRKYGDGPLHECTDAGWHTVMDANVKSVFATNREAVRWFLQNKQPGVILNMASVLAWSPSPMYFDTIAYAAAKGGVIALSRAAAARYAPDGIRVNVLAPGLIETPMSQRACSDPAILSFLRTKQPLTHGPGNPEDCSEAAVFLCSDAARMITGAVLPVDGGWCVSEGQIEE